MFLRANQPLQKIAQGISRTYDNAVQSGSQALASANQKVYDTKKKHIMNMGSNHYNHLRKDNNANGWTRERANLSNLNGEMNLDKRFNEVHGSYTNRHSQITKAQNKLTSSEFKSNLGGVAIAGGVVGTGAMMSQG